MRMNFLPHAEYSLKIPVKIKKKLWKILKHSSSSLKFEELSLLFEKKYKCKLELSLTDNDIIIEIDDDDKFGGELKYDQILLENESQMKYPEEELKILMSKIDFTLELCRKSKKPLSHECTIHSSNYFIINLSLPFPDTTRGSISEDPQKVGKISTRKIEIHDLFNVLHCRVGDVMPVFIGKIYDPTKFWIRCLPIDVFEATLCDFYDINKSSLSVILSDVCIGFNCVALVSNLYFRARIIRRDVQNPKSVKIFSYDYGISYKVHLSQLYHLHETFSEIPAFAVKAMLTNISSLDHQMWSQNSVDRFVELTDDKPLIAHVAHIHTKRKILEIHLLDTSYQKKGKIPTINYHLVCDGLAKFSYQPLNIKKEEKKQFKPLKELLYLYPSLEMIENGLAPSHVNLTEELEQCVPLDVIFPEFYEYLDQNE